MNSHMHARLTKDEVKKIYDREFADEFNVVVTNIRSVTRGNAAFANSWRDWIGVGSISAGVISINAVFGLLSAFGVIPGFVGVIVNFSVAIAGIVAGIAYQKYGINKKRLAYQDAELFIENELPTENVDRLREKLFAEIYPALQDSTPSQINIAMKAVMAAFANLILNKQVTNFEQLMSKDSRVLLSLSMQKAPPFAMNTRLLQSMLQRMPDVRNQAEVVDRQKIIERVTDDRTVKLSTAKSALWSPPQTADQSIFASEEHFKSLHLR